MKYCITYNPEIINTVNKADEITFEYRKTDTTMLEFLKQKPDKRFIITIKDIENFIYNKDYQTFLSIKEENPEINFTLLFEEVREDINLKTILKDIPYFYSLLANNWDTFLGLCDLGVSDIYVVEELGFQLDKVAEIAHSRNIKIRTFANVCQTAWNNTNSLFTFFIRPEDVELYSQYIDVLEFFTTKTKNIELLYKIYHDDKKWFGNLEEIIVGFNTKFDSKYVLPTFAEQRVKCDKNCQKGGKCRICHRIKELSETLEQAGIMVEIEKTDLTEK